MTATSGLQSLEIRQPLTISGPIAGLFASSGIMAISPRRSAMKKPPEKQRVVDVTDDADVMAAIALNNFDSPRVAGVKEGRTYCYANSISQFKGTSKSKTLPEARPRKGRR
jgi:hypothetical protein